MGREINANCKLAEGVSVGWGRDALGGSILSPGRGGGL